MTAEALRATHDLNFQEAIHAIICIVMKFYPRELDFILRAERACVSSSNKHVNCIDLNLIRCGVVQRLAMVCCANNDPSYVKSIAGRFGMVLEQHEFPRMAVDTVLLATDLLLDAAASKEEALQQEQQQERLQVDKQEREQERHKETIANLMAEVARLRSGADADADEKGACTPKRSREEGIASFVLKCTIGRGLVAECISEHRPRPLHFYPSPHI